MPGRGPAPKPADQRHGHLSKADKAVEQLDPEVKVAAPPLPNAERYTADTIRWWANWCSSPQAQRFLPTDWQRLAMVAPLVDEFFRTPKATILAEVRLNESLLGATPADRLRLRWEVPKPTEPNAIEQVLARRRLRVVDERPLGGAS